MADMDATRTVGKRSRRLLMAVWLVPIGALLYVGWMNLVPLGGTTTYFIDVGGDDVGGPARLIGPRDRLSAEVVGNGTSFREIEKTPVYFELDTRRLRYADQIETTVRFKKTLPDDGRFVVGARDGEEASYCGKDLYAPFYEQLSDLTPVAEDGDVRVYARGNGSNPAFGSLAEFQQSPPVGSVIARSDPGLDINRKITPAECPPIDVGLQPAGESLGPVAIQEIGPRDVLPLPLEPQYGEVGRIEANTSLRIWPHTFYFPAEGDVEVEVAKRDLNWYEGADDLDMLVYSLDGVLRGQSVIPDDGDIRDDRVPGPVQSSVLRVDGLAAGTYQLVLRPKGAGNDMVVTHLSLDRPKLVMVGNALLAGNLYLQGKPEPMVLWCYVFGESDIRFITAHGEALQVVTVSGDAGTRTIGVDAVNTWVSSGPLKPGIYKITAEKGDIHVVAPQGYLGFTRDSLFTTVSAVNGVEHGILVVNTALRDAHTFWTYVANGSLRLEATKQDLNWYDGVDDLAIEVYSLGGELKGSATITDDGESTMSGQPGPLQTGRLEVDGLGEGPYRVEFKCGGDVLVRQIRVNQEKFVVSKSANLIGMGPLCFESPPPLGPVPLYFRALEKGDVGFSTAHSTGIQEVIISGNSTRGEIDVGATYTWFDAPLMPGDYQLVPLRQDVVVAFGGYVSFTPDSYFVPTSSLNWLVGGNLVINTTLRDAHTLWTYAANGSLEVGVTKQDLNWYEGSDELTIEVYSLEGELRGNTTIQDDGDQRMSGIRGPLQQGNLTLAGLDEGAYRLELKCGGDLLIRQIKVNQQKLVVEKRVNLIGMNPVCFDSALAFDPVCLYYRCFDPVEVRVGTAHSTGLQTVTADGAGSPRGPPSEGAQPLG